MIETTVVPQQTDILLSLPIEYIGKKVRILMYAVEEIVEKTAAKPKIKAADFKQLFTADESKRFNDYLEQTRNEWERDI